MIKLCKLYVANKWTCSVIFGFLLSVLMTVNGEQVKLVCNYLQNANNTNKSITFGIKTC